MPKKVVEKDFDFYIDEYMYNCRSRRLRPKTMQSYEQTLRLFERWCADVVNISEPAAVTDSVLRRYICDLQERGKYTFYASEKTKNINCPERRRDYRNEITVTTINNYIRNLRAFFTWYSETEQQHNPMEKIKTFKNGRKVKDYLEDEEVERLLKCFDLSYFSEHRDYMITMLLLDTGMRIGECLKVTVDDVDMRERTITLPAENTKGRKDRVVFFSVRAHRSLMRWLRFKERYTDSELLFSVKSGTRLEVHTFERNFKKYIAASDIAKDVTPHALRNNFAKRCLMNGMDLYTLSRILGHSSVTVTEKAYLDLTDRDLRHRYQQFSPLENLRSR